MLSLLLLTFLMLQAPKNAFDVVPIFGWYSCYAGVRAFAVNPAVSMLPLYCLWRLWCCYFYGVLAVAEVPPLAGVSAIAGVPAVLDKSALADVPTVTGTSAAADGLTVITGIPTAAGVPTVTGTSAAADGLTVITGIPTAAGVHTVSVALYKVPLRVSRNS